MVERFRSEGMPFIRLSDKPRGGVRFDREEVIQWVRERSEKINLNR